MKIVAYYRVSTEKQGRSGLGLEAQRSAVDTFAAQRGAEVIERFTEIESGSKTVARPQLTSALSLAKLTGATLVIAKLDRLSRNAAFLLTLRDSGVHFIAADMPDATNLTVGIMAVVAQDERERISKRTREALAAAKARGRRLGNPNGAAPLRRAGKGNAAALAAKARKARERAADLRPMIEGLLQAGPISLRALAAELNGRGVRTARGGLWCVASTARILAQLGCSVGHLGRPR